MGDPNEPHGTHTTSPRGTGDGGRQTVVLEPDPTAPPERPSWIAYTTLDNDPDYGSEFEFEWEAGDCKNESCTQRYITITNPAGWEDDYLVRVTLHGILIDGASVRRKFHRRVADQFVAFFRAVSARGVADRILHVGGSHVARTLTGNERALSNHALGTAIDLNQGWNPRDDDEKPYGPARGEEGSLWDVVDLCADFGIFWGGWYTGRTPEDPMHFEVVKILQGDALRAVCETYGVDFDNLHGASSDDSE